MTTPVDLVLHQRSRRLEIAFDDGTRYLLPFEFLRVHSPSAEVRGHGAGQEVLQTGKRAVTIDALELVGHYGVRPRFSDGHDSGIYTWTYLADLGRREAEMWQAYLFRMESEGASRD